MKKPKTFLENGFPIDKLYTIALNEGNAKRPVYQIHKWWARRLGSVFRYLIISSFLSPHESVRDSWSKFYNGFSQEDKVIYDPMMGGGTSLVEGLRLGCKVIGCDINPVAWFVTKKEIERFDEELVDRYYKILEEKIGHEIKKLYMTKCTEGHDCESIYSFWIRVMNCRHCKKRIELFNNPIIRHEDDKDSVVCPKCLHVFHTKQKGLTIKCNSCKSSFNRKYSVVADGVFSCPHCTTKEKILNHIKNRGTFLQTKLFAIEYDCKICGRGIKQPDRNDLKLYEKARSIFLKNKNKLEFPRQRIPDIKGKGDRRPLTHGFKHFHELFNPRQLLALSLLLKEIKKIPEDNAREFLLLTFSSCLETNNVLCKYETNWGKISALFGVPGYHVPERYGENNVWGLGRGSFPRAYLKLKRGKKYATRAYEILYHKMRSRNRFQYTGETSIAEVSKDMSNFMLPGQRARLFCRDSSKMKMMKPKSVDLVFTDPPYFDVINYSRLADFFYVWLRLGLKDRYPWFKSKTSKRTKEILVNDDSMTVNGFVSSLTKILKESRRVLKDDGILLFTFHHTKPWAWKGLRKALKNSGFYVTATPIMRSEGRTGFRKDGNTSHDVFVVCRKLENNKKIIQYSSGSGYLKSINHFRRLHDSFTSSDAFTVLMSKYVSGDDITADKIMNNREELLEKIKRRTNIKSS